MRIMKDIEISSQNDQGYLARITEILGAKKINLEGGWAFHNGNHAIIHFLVKEAEPAKIELEKVCIPVRKINDVIILKLRQDILDQLGMFYRELEKAEVNILTQYSDHFNQLILIVDNYNKGKDVSEEWMQKYWNIKNYII